MSMMHPAPTMLFRKYSDEWWQQWRDQNADVRNRYRDSQSRVDRRALRRLQVSATFGMLHYVSGETAVLLREKSHAGVVELRKRGRAIVTQLQEKLRRKA